jgi:high-affinity nickel-transport protein
VEELLAQRGLIRRLFGGRLKFINRSWQMYPVGLLFGLGFDTASEVGLLAMTAGAAGALPWPAALSLPVLFAAGMSVMDTTDGVLMTLAYDWAFVNPVRRLAYNLFTTLLSVAVALVLGSLELAQLIVSLAGLHGGFYDRIADLQSAALGYVIAGSFLLSWALSVAIWRLTGLQQKLRQPRHSHAHDHAGVRHRHEHFH